MDLSLWGGVVLLLLDFVRSLGHKGVDDHDEDEKVEGKEEPNVNQLKVACLGEVLWNDSLKLAVATVSWFLLFYNLLNA